MKFILSVAAAVSMLLLLILPICASTQKTEVRIRLLDAHSGKPYVNRELALFGTNSTTGRWLRKDILFELHAKTGTDGVAHFQLEVPLPLRLSVYSYQAITCGRLSSFVTEEVMRSGIVDTNACARRKAGKFDWQAVTAHPGEITLFAVPPHGP